MGLARHQGRAEHDAGDHHLTSRYHYRKDILRHEKVQHRYVVDRGPGRRRGPFADIIRRVARPALPSVTSTAKPAPEMLFSGCARGCRGREKLSANRRLMSARR